MTGITVHVRRRIFTLFADAVGGSAGCRSVAKAIDVHEAIRPLATPIIAIFAIAICICGNEHGVRVALKGRDRHRRRHRPLIDDPRTLVAIIHIEKAIERVWGKPLGNVCSNARIVGRPSGAIHDRT